MNILSINGIITDKFGHKYSGLYTPAALAGYLEIDITELPDQLLTRHSGTFSLQIFKNVADESPCEPELFNFCDLEAGVEVRTVHFKMHQTNGEEKAFIGCHCAEE